MNAQIKVQNGQLVVLAKLPGSRRRADLMAVFSLQALGELARRRAEEYVSDKGFQLVTKWS